MTGVEDGVGLQSRFTTPRSDLRLDPGPPSWAAYFSARPGYPGQPMAAQSSTSAPTYGWHFDLDSSSVNTALKVETSKIEVECRE
jgi:hypothetical protein